MTDKDEDDDDQGIKQQSKRMSTIENRHRYLVALVTNSPQVRIVDEKFRCFPLDGHTDIVLAADVTPDG